MKLYYKFIIVLLFTIVFCIITMPKVWAASISVAPSKSSVSPGEQFSVTVSASGATGKVNISVSNGTVSKSSLWLEPSGSVTVTAGSSGTISINVNAADMSDAAGNEVSPSGRASVSIVVPQPQPQPSNGGGSSSSGSGNSGSTNNGGSTSSGSTGTTNNSKPNTTNIQKPEEIKKSNDATLKSLVIEGMELYPEFNTNINEYNVKVSNEITAVKIIPELNDTKAGLTIEGQYENLVVGENIASVVVKAEDGTTNRYIIKINRERESLRIQRLSITYIDDNEGLKELTPILQEGTLDYSLENVPYYIDKLDIDVLSNLENATIEVIGNEKLTDGENVITIKITMPSESEELEEVLVYTFTVNKETAPKVSLIGKVKNWFKGITRTIGTWCFTNQYRIIMGALSVCIVAMVGLSIYLIIDYKKYQQLLAKIAEVTKINMANANNVQTESVVINESNTEVQEEKSKGRHF